jgi:hypothetical protein
MRRTVAYKGELGEDRQREREREREREIERDREEAGAYKEKKNQSETHLDNGELEYGEAQPEQIGLGHLEIGQWEAGPATAGPDPEHQTRHLGGLASPHLQQQLV